MLKDSLFVLGSLVEWCGLYSAETPALMDVEEGVIAAGVGVYRLPQRNSAEDRLWPAS